MEYNLLYLEHDNDVCNRLKYACLFCRFDNQIQQIFHKKYGTKHCNRPQSNENNYHKLNCILHTVKYLIYLKCCTNIGIQFNTT